MYEEDDVITFGKLCEILIADPLYSQDDLTKEIVSPEWSKIKRPRILGFYNDYSPQRKLAILISKKNTLNIPQKYIAFAWVSYYGPNCLEAENEEKSIFRSALDSKEIKVVAVESFFKKYCIPHPATLFPQYSTNSKTVYDALIGNIPAGVKRRMSLTRIQKATSELQKNIDPVAVVQEAAVVEVDAKTANDGRLAATATTWGEVHIVFVNDYSIEIHCLGEITNKTYDEIGFSDGRRKEEPNTLWLLLKQFAEARGELSPADDISKQISNLRKALKSIFPHIHNDPIKHEPGRRAYVTVFATSSRISRE